MTYELDESGKRVVDQAGLPKEILQTRSWIALTGVVDHQALRDRLAKVVGVDVALMHPHYKRLDVERQERPIGGTWSAFSVIDYVANMRVLGNLPDESFEATPDDVRFAALVDPLPRLKTGDWEGVNVQRFIGRARNERAAAKIAYPTSTQPEIMIRFIDFTVKPSTAYRYRARVVLYNPLENGNDKYVAGPWSQLSWEITSR